jgi:hypothetical protein
MAGVWTKETTLAERTHRFRIDTAGAWQLEMQSPGGE